MAVDLKSSEIKAAHALFEQDISKAADILTQSKLSPEAFKKVTQKVQKQVGALDETLFDFKEEDIIREARVLENQGMPLGLILAIVYQIQFTREDAWRNIAFEMQQKIAKQFNSILPLVFSKPAAIMSEKPSSPIKLRLDCH